LIKADLYNDASGIKMASAKRRRLGIGLLVAIAAGALRFGLEAAGETVLPRYAPRTDFFHCAATLFGASTGCPIKGGLNKELPAGCCH
jgi:hypothetical protein